MDAWRIHCAAAGRLDGAAGRFQQGGVVQGHADPRGNPEKNLQLSQHRAESVRDYLVTYKQIPNERLQAIGKGDTELMNRSKPIAPESRRVTIVNLARQP